MLEDKPQVENICDDNPECHHQAPQSSNVEHGKPPSKSEEGVSPQVASWVKGEWTQVLDLNYVFNTRLRWGISPN